MKRVLVTGAASGLGLALARRLAARGDRLWLVDRDEQRLQRVAAELSEQTRVTAVVVDLATEAGVDQVVGLFRHPQAPLDVLINNAGITHRSAARETQPAVLRQVMAVDWQAPVELALGLLPALRAAGGSIVNIGSMAGWMPVPGRAGYCSAKAALGQFFEVLRSEEGPDGVHVLMVYPSFLDTPIERHALAGDGTPAAHARSTVGHVGDAGALAGDVLLALARRRAVLFPDRTTWLASLLWRLAPGLFHRLLRRRFAAELES